MLVSVVFYVWAGGIFHCLGRDFQPAATGFSTYFRVFRLLGRDFRTAAAGFSTYFRVFRLLGRDFTIGGSGILYLFPGFPPFG